MNKNNLIQYINLLNKYNPIRVNDELIEKDYILSLFLSNWAKLETPNLDKLIFKGGTLLTKNYLNYHRISEDLDFTHQDSNQIRQIKTKRSETEIKNRIIPILNEIEKITKKSNLDFINDRTNNKYIKIRNSRKLYILSFYYKSKITGLESFIKFEISFTENLINKPIKEEIKNIIDYHNINKLDLKIIKYNLEKPILKVYPIEEIILEKIRATITREQFKPRDVFDLYLINQNKNIFVIDENLIFQKLNSTPFDKNLVIENINNFIENEIIINLDDIYNLSIIEFDETKFMNFTTALIKYLKNIAKEFILKNE